MQHLLILGLENEDNKSKRRISLLLSSFMYINYVYEKMGYFESQQFYLVAATYFSFHLSPANLLASTRQFEYN